MFLTTLDFFGETHTPVVVDSSGIDVSEFEQEEDKKFLVEKGTELLRIDLVGEDAKAKICKAIDDRADDARGKIIYEIQEEFRSSPEKKGGLYRYFHSLGYWDKSAMEPMGLQKHDEVKASLRTAFRWANAYRGAKDVSDQLAGEYTEEEIQAKIAIYSPTVLGQMVESLSAKDRKDLYESSGPVKREDVISEAKKPERMINKIKEDLSEAQENLEKREAEWEEVLADPDIPRTLDDGTINPEYDKASVYKTKATSSVSKLEKKIKDLQEQIDARDKEEEKTAKAITKLKNEVDRLNAPEEEIKQRMLSTSNALIATLPNVHSHLQRFYTDIEHYDQDTVLVLEEHIKLVQSLIDAHL
jgi:hypothetical protein